MDNSISVIYIGGPTAILQIGGLRLMTDPALDPAGSRYQAGTFSVHKTAGPAKAATDNVDIVLLTHDQHMDNLDHAGRALVDKVSRTYTTVEGARRLGGTSTGLSPWQTDTVLAPNGTEITITATPGRHGPAGIEKINGDVIGFLLSVKSGKKLEIYITGDTLYYEGVAEVARRYDPKYVFIFAGAANAIGPFNVTMDNNDAIDTALAFPNATIIPLHYDGWSHYTQNEKDLLASYQVIGIDQRLKILEAGIPFVLDG
jgi:L-ascorbate metabolism protein UlaG (beta-lactamase superfamily)